MWTDIDKFNSEYRMGKLDIRIFPGDGGDFRLYSQALAPVRSLHLCAQSAGMDMAKEVAINVVRAEMMSLLTCLPFGECLSPVEFRGWRSDDSGSELVTDHIRVKLWGGVAGLGVWAASVGLRSDLVIAFEDLRGGIEEARELAVSFAKRSLEECLSSLEKVGA